MKTLAQPAARVQHPLRDPVASAFGQLTGTSPASARVHLYGPDRLNEKTALAIKAFLAVGADQRLVHWLVPIDLALVGLDRPALSPELHRQEEQADSFEDRAQVDYLLDPNTANRARLILALEKQIHRSQVLLAALRGEA